MTVLRRKELCTAHLHKNAVNLRSTTPSNWDCFGALHGKQDGKTGYEGKLRHGLTTQWSMVQAPTGNLLGRAAPSSWQAGRIKEISLLQHVAGFQPLAVPTPREQRRDAEARTKCEPARAAGILVIYAVSRQLQPPITSLQYLSSKAPSNIQPNLPGSVQAVGILPA